MGVELYWENVVRLREHMLVGRWEFIKMNGIQMKEWTQKSGASLLGYRPNVSVIVNRWFGFHFLNEEDALKIAGLPWVKGRDFLALQHWKVGFDPVVESPKRKIIWANYPALPLSYGQRVPFNCKQNRKTVLYG